MNIKIKNGVNSTTDFLFIEQLTFKKDIFPLNFRHRLSEFLLLLFFKITVRQRLILLIEFTCLFKVA